MNGSTLMQTGIGAGIATLGMLAILGGLGELKSSWAKWLLLAAAVIGGWLAYYIHSQNNGTTQNASTAQVSPVVTANATNIPSETAISNLEGPVVDGQPNTAGSASTFADLINKNVYTTNPDAEVQAFQNGINSGVTAMEQNGQTPMDAKSVAGLITIEGIPQIVNAPAPTQLTAQDVANMLQIIGPPPNQSYRPLSNTNAIDLAPVYGDLLKPTPAGLMENNAYQHNDQVIKH